MTPEALSRLNDLRLRVVRADEAARAGNASEAARIMPSDDEIIEALRAAREARAEALKAKSAKAADKANVDRFRTMSLDDLFG